jgi:transmembrane sensor
MIARQLDVQTLESAAGWYVDLRTESTDEALQAAHQHWLEQDPRHRRAWDRVLRLHGKFDGLSNPTLAKATISGAYARRRDVLKVLAVVIGTGTVGALGWRSTARMQWSADEYTHIGERRRVRLEDGTELQLNTATALNIRYGGSLREVLLLSGEIMVETGKDPAGRPFIVHTEEGSMLALGTRFVVFREAGITRLSVIQHAVQVRPAAQPATVATVDAGQQISFSAQTLGILAPTDPQVDAWTRNMLVVSNWRLEDFLQQLQRYRVGYLSCDPRVAQLRLSGAFNLSSPDAILENLRKTLPVRVRQFSRYWVRIEPA